MKYTAVGSYAGIGAMLIPLIGDKRWQVLGQHENRKIHTFRDEQGQNTFETNFNAPIWDKMPKFTTPPTLLAAQPKCGGFSSLYGTGRKANTKTSGLGAYGDMLVETIDDIYETQPDVFFVDNLAKSLLLITPDMWREGLPGYDIRFEWVSNYHYGNPQKGRNRLYIIGSRNGFRFVPREVLPGDTVAERIGDLVKNFGEVPNHDKHSRNDTDNLCNLAESPRWRDIAIYVRDHCKMGENLPYRAKDGTIKRRIGSNKLHWDKHSHTLAGIKGAKFHPLHGYPISIRERCRLQGYPDDFIIYGTKYMPDGTWSLRKNPNVVRQLNNTVPAEFCYEFISQLCYYLKHDENEFQPKQSVHAIKPNPIIEEANKR